ncbi:ABC transporter ATP-binding protein (plasmid) [Nitrobacteraceae bacterium UC4446_H13]
MKGLSIEHLSIATRDRRVIDDISFNVDQGEVLAILGETGSGKSLIGNAVMGLMPQGVQADGTIVVDGKRIQADDIKELRRFWAHDTFLLPQEPMNALAPLLSVASQVSEQVAGNRRTRRTVASAALEAMLLSPEHHRKRADQLSGGMAQRVMAAIASVTAARIILADEPTKGLDADRRAAVAGMFRLLKEDGRAIVLITHDIALVRQIADRVAFLHEGRLVEEGDAPLVLERPSSAYARSYVASDPATWECRRYVRSSTPKVLEVEGLRIGVGGRVLAEDVNFHCHANHISALLGESGVGKSTLAQNILGLADPMAGVIRRAFESTRGCGSAQKLHQDPTRVFSPWQSLGRSIQDLERLPNGRAAVKIIPELMRRFGLRPTLLERRPSQISGGEAQRLALARLLAFKPRFLIADEPTSRLDPPVQSEVIHHLRHLADEDGLAVLLITHDHDLAAAIADRRMLMVSDGTRPAQVQEVTRKVVGA